MAREAIRMTRDVAPMSDRRWLTAWVGDVPLALPLGEIREVLLWVPWQPAPPGQPGLVGVFPLRGETWPVWDIRTIWGWGTRAPDPETSYITSSRADGTGRGIVVADRTGWVIEGDPTDASPAGTEETSFTRWISDPDTGTVHFVFSPCDFIDICSRIPEGV